MKLQALYVKFSRNLKKEPVFGIKFKKLNLKLFRRNYSSCNRIYMFLEYLIPKRMFDIFFNCFFKKVPLTTVDKLNQTLHFTHELSKNNIFYQSFYPRLIMKNSFKISKDIFTSKSKDIFLKFSMLLVKKSKFMIYKKVENQSTIKRIIPI